VPVPVPGPSGARIERLAIPSDLLEAGTIDAPHVAIGGRQRAAIGQKRELFTYFGVKALYDYVHSTIRLSDNDRRAGVTPIPVSYNTGTYTVTRENVDLFRTTRR